MPHDEERTRLRGSIPNYLIKELDAYENNKVSPSLFLVRVLSNDLFGAFQVARIKELMTLPELVAYIIAYMPRQLYGSTAVVEEHLS